MMKKSEQASVNSLGKVPVGPLRKKKPSKAQVVIASMEALIPSDKLAKKPE